MERQPPKPPPPQPAKTEVKLEVPTEVKEEEGSSGSDADSDIESDEELAKVEAAQVAMKKAANEVTIPDRRRGASQQGLSWALTQPTPVTSLL